MNKIVWVFGCSASGKETFIRNVIQGNKIIKDLGWNDKTIVPIKESINYIKQSDADPIEFKRFELIERAIDENSKNSNSIIILKGQDYDFKHNLVQQLKTKTEDAEHIIIFLFSDLNTCFERMKQKKWFVDEEDGNIDEMKKHMIESANLVKSLNMPIISIDTTGEYIIVDFPNYDII